MISQKVIEFVAKFGLSIEIIGKDQICWIGKDNVIRTNNDSNALHELAHYIVASKNRRNKPNFGLGGCPEDTTKAHTTMMITYNEAQKEEELASCLGILFEKQLKLEAIIVIGAIPNLQKKSILSYKITYGQHSWNESYGPTFEDTIKRLQDMGIVGKNKLPFGYKRILKAINK